jgi:hypothetical protein
MSRSGDQGPERADSSARGRRLDRAGAPAARVDQGAHKDGSDEDAPGLGFRV